MTRVPDRIGQLAAIAVASALAGAAFTRVFPGPDLVVPVLGAAILPVALGSALHETRRERPLSGGVVVAVQALGFVLFCLIALTHQLSPSAIGTVVGGAVHGWADILTSSLPAAPTATQLVVVPIVAWTSSSLAVGAALRSRSPMLPILPLIIAFVGPHFLGAGAAGFHPLVDAFLFLGAIGVLIALRVQIPPENVGEADRGRQGGRPVGRRLWAALSIVLVTALAAALVGQVLPFATARAPFDLRTLRQPAVLSDAFVNPLAEIKGRLADPNVPLFTVTTQMPAGAAQEAPTVRVRLAILDAYNGAQWTGPDTFLPAGPDLSQNPVAEGKTVTLHQTVTVQQLGGYLIPAAPWPVQIEAPAQGSAGLAFNAGSGVLVDTAGLRPGFRYTVTEQVPVYNLAALSAARVMTGAAAAPFLALPAGLPDSFRQISDQAIQNASTDFQKVSALQQFLELHYTNTVQAPAGDSAAQLATFLSDAAYGHAGTSEQFAAAFAVLGRIIGLPTRVVVGFQPSATGVGTHTVTNADILAWPEVWFAGFGWVPFDPTPPQGSNVVPFPEQKKAPGVLAKAVGNGIVSGTSTAAAPPVPVATPAQKHATSGTALWVALVIVVLALLAGGIFGIVGAKRRRRRVRRTTGTVSRRILGAWLEAVGRLRQRGLPPVRTMTAHEVAAAAESLVGADADLQGLAALLNESLYAAGEQEASRAEEAWACLDRLEQRLDEGTSTVARLRQLVDPRPLIRQ